MKYENDAENWDAERCGDGFNVFVTTIYLSSG